MISRRDSFTAISTYECRNSIVTRDCIPLFILSLFFQNYLKHMGMPCLNNSYTSYVTSLNNTRLDPTGEASSRQWFYQTCSQFGYCRLCFTQTAFKQKQSFGFVSKSECFSTRFTMASLTRNVTNPFIQTQNFDSETLRACGRVMPRIRIPFMSSLLERSTSSLASRTYASRNGPQLATTYFAKRFIFFLETT